MRTVFLGHSFTNGNDYRLCIAHRVCNYGLTAYMYRLMLSKDKASVFQYDREYRREQSQHQFRWGTHVSHLNDVCLRQKTVKREQKPQSGTRDMGPETSAGKVICKRFNSTAGCNLAECKFLHVCSIP